MRNWFPFSDYDFWGYLASGTLLLAGADYAFNGSALVTNGAWTAPQIILAVLSIYLTGHVIASFSGLVVEAFIGNRLLRSPTPVLLGLEKRGPIQSALAQVIIGRYYRPFAEPLRNRIVVRASELMGVDPSLLSPDGIFQTAFCKARESEDIRSRIDSFRNQYGFCRNLAFTCIVVALLVATHRSDPTAIQLSWALFGIGLVMLFRFLKFYSHFNAEVLRGLVLTEIK